MNGDQLPMKESSESNWGAFDHASHALSDNYRKSGNFRCKNIFVVDGGYEI